MVYSDKDTGVRNSNFVAKTQFLCRSEIYTDRFIIKLDFKMNGKDKRTLMHLFLFTYSAQRELVSICTQSIRERN